MRDWIDISVPLAPGVTPLYPGTPAVRFEKILSLDKNDIADDTVLHFGLHSGTHLDMPSHFIAGAPGIDSLDLSRLNGKCQVLDFRGDRLITEAALQKSGMRDDVRRFLFLTDNSKLWTSSEFSKDFVGLSLDGAKFLSQREIELVGNDYLSVQPMSESHQVHIELLKANIVILEGINLSHAEPGIYELLCLPLKVLGVEGAPARALLRKL